MRLAAWTTQFLARRLQRRWTVPLWTGLSGPPVWLVSGTIPAYEQTERSGPQAEGEPTSLRMPEAKTTPIPLMLVSKAPGVFASERANCFSKALTDWLRL